MAGAGDSPKGFSGDSQVVRQNATTGVSRAYMLKAVRARHKRSKASWVKITSTVIFKYNEIIPHRPTYHSLPTYTSSLMLPPSLLLLQNQFIPAREPPEALDTTQAVETGPAATANPDVTMTDANNGVEGTQPQSDTSLPTVANGETKLAVSGNDDQDEGHKDQNVELTEEEADQLRGSTPLPALPVPPRRAALRALKTVQPEANSPNDGAGAGRGGKAAPRGKAALRGKAAPRGRAGATPSGKKPSKRKPRFTFRNCQYDLRKIGGEGRCGRLLDPESEYTFFKNCEAHRAIGRHEQQEHRRRVAEEAAEAAKAAELEDSDAKDGANDEGEEAGTEEDAESGDAAGSSRKRKRGSRRNPTPKKRSKREESEDLPPDSGSDSSASSSPGSNLTQEGVLHEKALSQVPRPSHNMAKTKLFNPQTDPIPMLRTAEPEAVSDATSSSYAPRGPSGSPNNRELSAHQRQLFDHRKDDPHEKALSQVPRPSHNMAKTKLFNPQTDPIPMLRTAEPEAVSDATSSSYAPRGPSGSPNNRELSAHQRQLFDHRKDDPSSADYVSASSTSSYAHSIASLSFTLSSGTTESSASSALFERRPSEETGNSNAFAVQLKLYRGISSLETRILNEDVDDSAADESHVLLERRAKEVVDEDAEKQKWRKLIDDHKRFPPNIPTKYNTIIRLWTHAFHRLLESLRRASFTSPLALERLQDFIYYAYTFYTGILEEQTLRTFRARWLEALGDLERYRTAVAAMVTGSQGSGPKNSQPEPSKGLLIRNVNSNNV
ncbi:hypothetical protein HWV62_39776 [Athelia sp. TMB]|nr:hypothetical protein HWV62_39776 [Athelia sp. TMB]